jgi:hypothetical protein
LSTKATKPELELWAQLWASPQATAWEELGWVRTVAKYARVEIRAERSRATGAVMSESRQLEDRLGLNPKAMRSLGWEISPVDAVPDGEGDAGPADLDAFRARIGS